MMATGSYDENGFYSYGEDDLADPGQGFSDLLNKSAEGVKLAVPVLVHNRVTEELASDPTIRQAATQAVGTEIQDRDIVQGTDSRLVTYVDGEDDHAGVFGARGEHTSATVRVSDGGPSDIAEQLLRDRLGVVVADGTGAGVTGSQGEATAATINPTTGLLTTEAADLLRLSVPERRSRITSFARTSVRVPVDRSASRPLVPSRTRLLIAGDSHAAATDVAVADRWHTRLAQARPDLTLTHASRGGSTSHMVALMAGAIEPAFALTGGALPASGTVTATLTDTLSYRANVSLGVTPGVAITSQGEVPVTIERAVNETMFTIKRTTAGAEIAGPIRFRASTWEQNAGDLLLVMMGQNDQVTSLGDVSPVVEGYSALIESRAAIYPKAMFMGLVLGGTTTPYSPAWKYNLEIDAELQRLWPEHYWSLARWLVEDALDLVAITPTAQDISDRRSYRTPRSLLLSDMTHMNAATQAALTPVLITELVARNLINPAA